MQILWYENVSWTRYKKLLLTEKIMRNYSGFYQNISGTYIVFVNYIAGLTLPRKIILLQFLSDCKRSLLRSKFLYENFSPSPTLSYTITKKLKKKFAARKPLRLLKLLRALSDRVLFAVLSDSVLFRFLSDLVFLRFLGDRVLSDILEFYLHES